MSRWKCGDSNAFSLTLVVLDSFVYFADIIVELERVCLQPHHCCYLTYNEECGTYASRKCWHMQ